MRTSVLTRVLCLLLLMAVLLTALPCLGDAPAAVGGDEETALPPIAAHGIDLSHWQGEIDWALVKADGVDFVILRAGTGMGKDIRFEENYTGAKAAGLDVGCYYYTYAKTPADAQKEAEELCGWLEGKQLEYPVFYDIEDTDQSSLPDNAARTALCAAFIGHMRDAGWCAGVYSTKYWFENLLDLPALMAMGEIWLAHWPESGKPDIDYSRYGLWQYASDGHVNGVEDMVDLDVAYKDYPALMKKYGWNGYSATSPLFGDANGDKRVNTADAAATLQYAAELLTDAQIQPDAADVNGDGRVTTADASLILQFAAELLERFPADTGTSTTPTTPTTPTTSDTDATTTQPSGTTTEPSDTTTQPSGTTTEPSDTTTQPSDTTTEPSDTTTEPSDMTTQPSTTTTTEPTTTTTKPIGITLPFVPA